MTPTPWYAGQCTNLRALVADISVTAREEESGWVVVDNAHKLFPKAGMVEIKSATTKSIKIGDWFIFHGASNHLKRGPLKASQPRQLYPFADFSEKAGISAVKQLFLEEGWDGGEARPGLWAVKASVSEVLLLDLVRGEHGKFFASNSGKINHAAFAEGNRINMPARGVTIQLYDFAGEAEFRGKPYDWSPEKDYIIRVIRSLAGKDDRALQDIITWLELHADEKSGQVLIGGETAFAHEALRSGELAARLTTESSLLSAFGDALRNDPVMVGLLEKAAAVMVARDGHLIRADLEAKIGKEVSNLRATQMEKMSEELSVWEGERRKEIESRFDEEITASELLAKERRSELENELQLSLQEVTATEAAKLASLQLERSAIEAEISRLNTVQETLAKTLDTLNADTLIATRGHVQPSVVPSSGSNFGNTLALSIRWTERAATVSRGDFGVIADKCKLLTSSGAETMKRFVSLLLAGNVPILTGRDTNDFLSIAEVLLASGVAVTLEADPTIITFEDLWLRPGTNVPTRLAGGLSASTGNQARTVLAVISGAERSGARFWMPSLLKSTRCGDFGRRFLVCATVDEADGEEAKKVFDLSTPLDTSGAIAFEVAGLRSLILGDKARRELDPGDKPTDPSIAIEIVEPLVDQVTLEMVQRAVEAVAERLEISGDQSVASATSLARLILRKGDATAPNLTVIPGGN